MICLETRTDQRQTEPGHDCGPTSPPPPWPLLLALLRRHAGRCRHPCLDSGTVLCCYGNSVGSLVGGGRQPLCGNQHWRQQLCPFPEAVEAFLSDGEPFPLPSPEAAGGPQDFRAVTPGSHLHLSHRKEPGSGVERELPGDPTLGVCP